MRFDLDWTLSSTKKMIHLHKKNKGVTAGALEHNYDNDLSLLIQVK